jgi:NADP-dependent 3-hydroxy acid dehydrogenase YdfG
MSGDEARGLALVTGASRGIGAATVRALAAASFRVVAAARDRAALDRLAAETGAEALGLDVTSDADLAGLDGRPIDLAVLNAGIITRRGPFTSRTWRRSIARSPSTCAVQWRSPTGSCPG